MFLIGTKCFPSASVYGLTIVRDDGPGHGSSVNTAEHPKHAQPAQMLPSLLLGQEFRVIGKHNGNGATDTEEEKKGCTSEDDKRKHCDASTKGKPDRTHHVWQKQRCCELILISGEVLDSSSPRQSFTNKRRIFSALRPVS